MHFGKCTKFITKKRGFAFVINKKPKLNYIANNDKNMLIVHESLVIKNHTPRILLKEMLLEEYAYK